MKELKQELKDNLDPTIVYLALEDKGLNAEQELTDKYQAFSTELLRLSLLGIAVIGFIYKENLEVLPRVSEHYAALSAIFFGFSAVSALFHRYLSSETLRYYIRGLQWESKFLHSQELKDRLNAAKYLKYRQKIMWGCVILKFLSTLALAIGAGFLAYAFVIPLW